MDIIIFSGQSNMQGQTESFPKKNEYVPNAWEYHFESDSLEPLCHPVGENLFYDLILGSHEKFGSLVPAFCRSYIREARKEVVAVHVARGGTTITEWIKGTSRYYYAKQKILSAIRKVKELYTVEHIYFVWLQGESDALIKTSKSLYLNRLLELKNTLKEEVGIEKFGIIKVGYFAIYAGWVAGTQEEKRQWDETIMLAQEEAVKNDCDFVMLTKICPELSIKQEYLNPNAAGHYTNEALEKIGESAGKTLALLT